MAIAIEEGDAYSADLASSFQSSFGSGVVSLVTFSATEPDYTTKLGLLLTDNPEAIFISMLNPDVYVKFFDELGYLGDSNVLNNTSFILCDGLYSSDLFQAPIGYILGELNGYPKNFGAFPSADTSTGAYIHFRDELYDRYGQEVAGYNAQFFDIAYLYAMAIENALILNGTGDMAVLRKAVNDYIRPVSHGTGEDPLVMPSQGWLSIKYACRFGDVNYSGASGNCDIDAEGNAVTPYSVFRVVKPGGNYSFEIIRIIQ